MRLIRLLKNDLAREITAWVAENIISTEQAELICSRYGIDYHHQNRHSYGYFILVALGYLFVGLALITLISANWEQIPRAVRMSGLIALTLVANLIGIYKVKQDNTQAAIGCFFLGGIFYGASIMLIAQIYHIGEHFPDGIFWWALGILPMALLMQSSLLMLLSATLAFIWFFVESYLNFYPTLFPVFLIALAWHCFRVKQSNILFIALIIGIGFCFEYTWSWALGGWQRFEAGPENLCLVISLFVFFYAFSKWLNTRPVIMFKDYGALLGVWTLRFALVLLFVFSFKEPWKDLIKADWEMPGLAVGLSFIIPVLSIWLVHISQKPIISITFYSVLFILVLLSVIYKDMRHMQSVFQIGDNIVLIISGVWLIIKGIQNAVSHYFFLGIVAILATGLIRYVDLVGDYVGAAILFAVFAAILLSAAKFWKSQQSVSTVSTVSRTMP